MQNFDAVLGQLGEGVGGGPKVANVGFNNNSGTNNGELIKMLNK